MIKFLSILIFCAFIINPITAYSASELYESDEEIARDVSKKFNTDIERVRVLMIISSAEKASGFCNFKLTQHFYNAKSEILKYKLDSKIYNYLSTLPFTIPMSMKKSWCDQAYKLYAPNGNPKSFFK